MKGKPYLSGICAILILLGTHLAPSDAIVIKPGRLDRFVLDIPKDIRAGEEFTVGLNAYDAYGNLVTNLPETGRDIQVSVTGLAEVRPQVLKASLFVGGKASVTVSDKKAENITLTLYEVGGTVPLHTKEISIAPNKLSHFVVSAPESAVAGRHFELKVTAKDAFGNTVRDEALSKEIKLSPVGDVELKGISAPDFNNGVSVVSLLAERTGTLAVEVKDMVKGGTGRSPDIKITPSALHSFSVSVPGEAEAGKPFEVAVTAMDAYLNTAYNYSSYGGGVNITTSGKSAVSPSFIKPSEFIGGQGRVTLLYNRAEDITLTVTEQNGTQRAESSPIKVSPSGLERLVIQTPEEAVAGQKFRIRVEAYDRFDNPIVNYSQKGSDIILKASGTGTLTPSVVAASEFIKGAASVSVEVSYDRAEALSISAAVLVKGEAVPQRVSEKPAPLIRPEKKPEVKAPTVEEKKKVPTVAKKVAAKPFPKVFEVSDITVVEAQNKAMFIIKIQGLSDELHYREGIESSEGKDWVKLRLKPARSIMKDTPGFKSGFIGTVKVKKGASPEELDILFELLPQKVKYDIQRDADSLIVNITLL